MTIQLSIGGKRIDDIISDLTLEEKANLCGGKGFFD
jgi:hypothetical protein